RVHRPLAGSRRSPPDTRHAFPTTRPARASLGEGDHGARTLVGVAPHHAQPATLETPGGGAAAHGERDTTEDRHPRRALERRGEMKHPPSLAPRAPEVKRTRAAWRRPPGGGAPEGSRTL